MYKKLNQVFPSTGPGSTKNPDVTPFHHENNDSGYPVAPPDWNWDNKTSLEIKGDNWYINMGNIYLESEMKKADKADVELYKAWFEIALLLYGLSIKKTLDEEKDLEETDKLANLSLKSIAPTVIPVLRSLPNLKL